MGKIIKKKDTRRVFVDTLNELAAKDPNIIVITCDVGFNYLDNPNLKFRVINLGVTESTSTIIAAGFALSGYSVWLYSMINFVVFRPYEAVRNAICLHHANVKIIGVKGSEKYKFLGFSHNMIVEDEDIKALKNFPNIKSYIVTDPEKTKEVILETYHTNSPCYIRL